MAIGQSIPAPEGWQSGAGGCLSDCDRPKGRGYHRAAAQEEDNVLWMPGIATADESKRDERKQIHARTLDLARNNPLVNGALRSEQSAVVGDSYKLDLQIDAKAIGISEDQADELKEEIEDGFDRIADSPRCWLDAAGRNTFSQLCHQTMFVGAIYGEHFSVLRSADKPLWRPTRQTYIAIDPNRVADPVGMRQQERQNKNIYHGIDRAIETGYPVAYYIKKQAHADRTVRRRQKGAEVPWRRVARTDSTTGLWLCLHLGDFAGLPHDTRPLPPMASVVHLIHRTGRYSDAVLDHVWKAALLGLYMKSDMPTQIGELFQGIRDYQGTLSGDEKRLLPWQLMTQHAMEHFAAAGTKVLDKVRANVLPVGTDIGVIDPKHPTEQHEAFLRTQNRDIAVAVGKSYESLTGDRSQTNFHGAMLGDMEMWQRRKLVAANFPARFGTMVVQNWLTEGFLENRFQNIAAGRTEVDRLNWWLTNQDAFKIGFVGPAREWANPQMMESMFETAKANGTMTVDMYAKRHRGMRGRDLIRQQAREEAYQKRIREEYKLAADEGGA